MRHRGPDSGGQDVSAICGIAMRRLAIIDVANGRQPITSDDGRFSIVFNGEIYNYKELRQEMLQRGHRFRTESDTEVILRLYIELGAACLSKLLGMFTIAILDRTTDRLFLARDRLGIKPLYLHRSAGKLWFASEVKALLDVAEIQRSPNMRALDQYLSLRYVPGPESLFEGIEMFPAAHWAVWENGELHCERYWRIPDQELTDIRSDEDAYERYAELFERSVKRRLISEVPLGSFLSGGLDSTAIVASMARQTNRPVKTFSIGFDWEGDEHEIAAETARRLGCEHHGFVCKPEDMSLLPQIVWSLDEPVGDAIVVPMYLLAKNATQHVSVVLTGEGADETLGGYFFHRVLVLAARIRRLTPGFALEVLDRIIRSTPVSVLNPFFDYPGTLGERGRDRLAQFARLLRSGDTRALYHFLLSLFSQQDKEELYGPDLLPLVKEDSLSTIGKTPAGDDLNSLLSMQFDHWLPSDILTKQDKMTMASSIEGRVPFLDHELVEFAMRLPAKYKCRGKVNKLPLRHFLKTRLPGEAANRKKVPFYIPIDHYLSSGPLKELADHCLSEDSVRKRGIFRWETVKRLRDAVQPGEFLYGKQVMSLLMLELWYRIFIDQEQGWT